MDWPNCGQQEGNRVGTHTKLLGLDGALEALDVLLEVRDELGEVEWRAERADNSTVGHGEEVGERKEGGSEMWQAGCG